MAQHRRHGIVLALALLVTAALAGVAWADPIGPDCGSCFGGIFTLQFVPPDDGSVTIIYTADLTNTTGGVTDIDAIAFKVVSGGKGNEITGGSLDSFTVNGVASAVWGTDFQISGLASAGCDTPSGGFACSENVNGADGGPAVGDVLQWTFTLDYTGTLFTDPGAASIKADFSPGKGLLLSEAITLQQPPPPVPEPGTLMLLGTGLLGVGLARRIIRRRRQ